MIVIWPIDGVVFVLSFCATLSCYLAARAVTRKPQELDSIPRLDIPNAKTFEKKQDRYINNAAELLEEGYKKVRVSLEGNKAAL